MGILLRHGSFHTAKKSWHGDLLISGKRILKISDRIEPSNHRIVDCKKLDILPGVIDAHVHFREPGNEDKETFESGSRAAAAGGVTTVLDMPNNTPPVRTVEDLKAKRKLAKSSLVNYGLYVLGFKDNLEELDRFTNIPGIKVYLGSSTGNYLTDDLGMLAKILNKARVPVVVHAENESLLRYFNSLFESTQLHHKIRDPLCAVVSVAESTLSAEYFGKRMHLAHVSTKAEVDYLRKNKTSWISCEVSPHHLYLSEAFFLKEGNLGKMNPPLREKINQDALWTGIEEGLIDMIATDHAPHSLVEKGCAYPEAPCGVPGVQTLLPLLLDSVAQGKLTMNQVALLCSENPARIFGIQQRGKLMEGHFADLVIVDRNKRHRILNDEQYSKCGWTPFHNMEVEGSILTTIVNGSILYDQGKFFPTDGGMEVDFDNEEGGHP